MPAVAMPAPAEPQKIEVKLDADVANARVVFRRRVANAPVAMRSTRPMSSSSSRCRRRDTARRATG